MVYQITSVHSRHSLNDNSDIFHTFLASIFFSNLFLQFFTPQPLRAVGVLFSPMVSGWMGGRREKFVPAVSPKPCRKLILGRDIG